MNAESLESAINSGAVERVLDVLAGATEPSRAACADVPRRAFERLAERRRELSGPSEEWAQLDRIEKAAWAALLGTAARPDSWALHTSDPDLVVGVLQDRRPTWLQSWAEKSLRDLPQCWPAVRRMERAGLIRRPPNDIYAIGFITAGAAQLDTDPELLDDVVWLLFEVEGDSSVSLANGDKWSAEDRNWSKILRRLSGEGRLSRSRLLTCSLEALNRDFIQFRAGWFSRFHEALEPTLAERETLADRYLGLLNSSIPPTVSFALRALQVLDRAGKLAPDALLAAVTPALAAREKATVSLALKLTERAGAAEPGDRERGALVAAGALMHENPEIQAAALAAVERLCSPPTETVVRALAAHTGSVAASLQGRLRSFIGAEGPPPPAPEPVARLVASCAVSAPETVHPVADLDELIALLTGLLEVPEPAVDLERALDGLSRLGAEQPVDFERRTAPLRKRARKLFRDVEWMNTWWGSLRQDLAALVLVWTGDPVPAVKPHSKPDVDRFLGERMREVALRLAARRCRPLLAFPVHPAGWIPPDVLLERVREAEGWDPADAVAALLRMSAPHDESLVPVAARLPESELSLAFRRALGDTVKPCRSKALWEAAELAHNPAKYSVRLEIGHETRTYDGKTYHYYPVQVRTDPPLPRTSDLLRVAIRLYSPEETDPAARRWASTIWPAGREAWFGAGAAALGDNLDWWEAVWANRVYLEALLDPRTELGEMGRLLLAVALAAKEPGESGLGVDALVASVREGRLDAEGLGAALGTLAHTGMIKASRWAATLGIAARSSSHLRELVRAALETLLGSTPEFRPADLVPLLTLLIELNVECGQSVRSPAARNYLGGVTSGKAGSLAKALLAGG